MSDVVMSPKDPDEELDYTFNWAKWLAKNGDDTIVSQLVTATCVTVESAQIVDNTKVVALLSGGAAGTRARVTCTITTAANRTVKRSMTIPIKSL